MSLAPDAAVSVKCGGLAPLCCRSLVIKAKAAPGRRTPWRRHCFWH